MTDANKQIMQPSGYEKTQVLLSEFQTSVEMP